MTDLGLFINSCKKRNEAQLLSIVPHFVCLFKSYFTPQKLSPLNIKELYQYGANMDAYDDSPLVPFRAINATFSHKFTYFRQFFTKK